MTKRKAQVKAKRVKQKAVAAGHVTPTRSPGKSKAAACIALLSRKEGASIADLQKATGWQPHSVRGFMSGKIKKIAGLKLTSEKAPGSVRRYHVKST